MSIAIIYDVSYPFVEGGGQKRLFEVGRRLVSRGWNVDWYCFKTWKGNDILIHEGINYYGLPGYSNMYTANGRRSIKEAVSFGWAVLKTIKRLKQYSILWFGQWPYFHLLSVKSNLKIRNIPIVIDWWETWNKHWIEYLGILGIFGIFLERILVKSGHLVVNSSMGRNDAIKIGANPDLIILIHNGIDFKFIEQIKPHPQKTDIISFGRLKNHKNIDHLIKALFHLKKKGKKIKLHIIGDGPERERLYKHAVESGVQDRVVFLGHIHSSEELYQRLKSALLFVHPSTKEGGGSISLFEANACGLPVIAYDHPLGIDPKLIEDNVNGKLVRPVSPNALASTIEYLLSNRELLYFMKQKSIEKSKTYDWENITDDYESFFKRLVLKSKQ